jgi:CDGSH-type Zn-finger protein
MDEHQFPPDEARDDANTSGEASGTAKPRLKISCRLNGPLHFEGNLSIENEQGESLFRSDDAWLCRCGHSKNKPFCDGSHKTIGFRTSDREGFPPSRSKS